uniref:Uncharacterized protein n=1 Tax=Rhodosorus marinus TaxID=101924 RepID=A0A7S3EEH7_9RHOD
MIREKWLLRLAREKLYCSSHGKFTVGGEPLVFMDLMKLGQKHFGTESIPCEMAMVCGEIVGLTNIFFSILRYGMKASTAITTGEPHEKSLHSSSRGLTRLGHYW